MGSFLLCGVSHSGVAGDSREASRVADPGWFQGQGTAGIWAASASMEWAEQAPGSKRVECPIARKGLSLVRLNCPRSSAVGMNRCSHS